jgi:glycosyltransferase involved in cell wall biosynthesis
MSVTRSAPKVVVVMPAYNAGQTLRLTYEELPKDTVNLVILVDDGSTDATLDIARQLGLEIFVHNRNYGYGANQKTCYAEALRAGAEIVVMVRGLPVRSAARAADHRADRAAGPTWCWARASRKARRSRRGMPGSTLRIVS